MSTLKVDAIRHNSATSDAITTAADGTCTARITGMSGGGELSHRNKVINGGMMIHQRGDASATGSAAYLSCDRFRTYNGSGAQVAVTKSTDTPDGFSASTKWDCTTADTSVAASDYFMIQHKIEGQNIQDFAKGTSSAKQFALSFYIKATKTGVYTIELEDTDNDRACSKTITVSNTNWNRYSIIYPADTTGAFNNDNGGSLTISFWLMGGSNYTSGTLQTSAWGARVSANRVSSSNVNAFDSTSNDFYLTGVQLEVGDTVTSFEHRSFGDELARCQRYCVQYNSNNANRDYIMPAKASDADDAYAVWQPPVAPRTTYPSISVSNTSHLALEYGDFSYSSPINFSSRDNTAANPYSPIVFLNFDLNENVLSSGQMVYLAFANNTTGGYLRFEWEL